jgi:hypothetical protein
MNMKRDDETQTAYAIRVIQEDARRPVMEELERLREHTRALGDAYLRLRVLIPGALDTPHAPTEEQVWETTERALSKALTAGQ